MAKYCAKCGNQVNKNADFCERCGAKLGSQLNTVVKRVELKQFAWYRFCKLAYMVAAILAAICLFLSWMSSMPYRGNCYPGKICYIDDRKSYVVCDSGKLYKLGENLLPHPHASHPFSTDYEVWQLFDSSAKHLCEYNNNGKGMTVGEVETKAKNLQTNYELVTVYHEDWYLQSFLTWLVFGLITIVIYFGSLLLIKKLFFYIAIGEKPFGRTNKQERK